MLRDRSPYVVSLTKFMHDPRACLCEAGARPIVIRELTKQSWAPIIIAWVIMAVSLSGAGYALWLTLAR